MVVLHYFWNILNHSYSFRDSSLFLRCAIQVMPRACRVVKFVGGKRRSDDHKQSADKQCYLCCWWLCIGHQCVSYFCIHVGSFSRWLAGVLLLINGCWPRSGGQLALHSDVEFSVNGSINITALSDILLCSVMLRSTLCLLKYIFPGSFLFRHRIVLWFSLYLSNTLKLIVVLEGRLNWSMKCCLALWRLACRSLFFGMKRLQRLKGESDQMRMNGTFIWQWKDVCSKEGRRTALTPEMPSTLTAFLEVFLLMRMRTRYEVCSHSHSIPLPTVLFLPTSTNQTFVLKASALAAFAAV